MALFYTQSSLVKDHPLNKEWIDLHYLSDEDMRLWWSAFSQIIVQDYEENGMPPRKGTDEVDIYRQFRSLVSCDVDKQISRDTTDGGAVILNSLRIPAATHFFENMYVAKDKQGDKWISVMDVFKNPLEFDSIRLIKNDARFVYSDYASGRVSIEEYISDHHDKYDFWFHRPAKKSKHLFGKVHGKVSDVKSLAATKVLDKRVLLDLEGFSDSDIVYLKQITRGTRILPLGFTVFQSSTIMAPTNFPSVVAKTIYSKFALPKEGNDEVIIWDPSMGFGGRLLGALSTVDRKIHYIGTDPNSLNYFHGGSSRYGNLERVFKSEIRSRRDNFTGTYIKSGSEDVHTHKEFKKLKGKVDLVFTSPPYFSAELYNEEATQSSIKYKNYDDWRRLFLTQTLLTAATWVRKDGYVLWNIANSGGYPLEEDTKLICQSLGLTSKGVIKMMLAKTPGMKSRDGKLTTWNFARVRGKQAKYEPIFVFQKTKDVPAEPRYRYSKLYTPK